MNIKDNIDIIICIMLLILEFIIAILDYMRVDKAFRLSKSITGEVVFVLHRSPLYLFSFGVIIIILFLALALGITMDYPIYYWFIVFVVTIFAVFENITHDLKPEKVYEYGVLQRREGFIPWRELDTVKITNSKGNQINLKRKGFQCDSLVLECLPGTASNIVEYIQSKIQETDCCEQYQRKHEHGLIHTYTEIRKKLVNSGYLLGIQMLISIIGILCLRYLLIKPFL